MIDNKVVMKMALDALRNHSGNYKLNRKECLAHQAVEDALIGAIAQPEHTAPPESALHSLARRCLWIAYCWNEHNFSEAHTYARKTAQELGINDFDEANRWLVVQTEQKADTGPWQVDVWPGKNEVVIQSDYFKHDTALIINGDFSDADEKRAYADELCAWMNSRIPQKLSAIEQTKESSLDVLDAARYRYIKSQMEAGAVRTDLPLTRSIYWVGSYVDCADVKNADESIDAAIKETK